MVQRLEDKRQPAASHAESLPAACPRTGAANHHKRATHGSRGSIRPGVCQRFGNEIVRKKRPSRKPLIQGITRDRGAGGKHRFPYHSLLWPHPIMVSWPPTCPQRRRLQVFSSAITTHRRADIAHDGNNICISTNFICRYYQKLHTLPKLKHDVIS